MKKLNPLKTFVPVMFACLAILEANQNAQWFRSYGDSGILGPYLLESSKIFSRWLLGSTVILDLWTIRSLVPGLDISSTHFSTLLGAIWMMMTSIFLLRVRGAFGPIILCLSSPIWIAFSLGYDEYYPFIVGLFMVYLLWIFDYFQLGRSGTAILLATLMVSYVGFSIFVLIGFVKILVMYRDKVLWIKTLALTAFLTLVLIEVCWPSGHTDYLAQLIKDMNLGEVNTIWPAYQGHAMSANLPVFEISYAISSNHLLEVSKMVLYGGGAGTVFFLFPFQYLTDKKIVFKTWIPKFEELPKILLVSYSVLYLLFMIPKIGPVIDIDLFFTSSFILLFWVGDRIQTIHLNGSSQKKSLLVVGCALAMVNLLLTYRLVISGL